MRSRFFGFALGGAALSGAAAARGLAADAVQVLDGGSALTPAARLLAQLVGERPALLALATAGGAAAALGLAATTRLPALPAMALLAAPLCLTGAEHVRPAVWGLGLAVAALQAWRERPLVAASCTAALALLVPAAGVAAALAGLVLRPGLAPLLLAAAAAALGDPAVADVTGLAAVRVHTEGWAAAPTAGFAAAGVLLLPGVPTRLRIAGLVSMLLTLGPVLTRDSSAGTTALPLPALPFAALGTGAGWAGAGIVALAVLALAAERSGPVRLGLVLLALEGVAAVRPLPSRLPDAPPRAVASLAERGGAVLHVPVGRRVRGEPARAALWRHQARTHGRPLYGEGRALRDDDPVFAEPGVAALHAVSDPDGAWGIAPTEAGVVLRALGITELVLDRAAVDATELARLDPVLARLYGPPQRDVAGHVDLWRIDPLGEAQLPTPPYLRRADQAGSQGWLTLEALLKAGRPSGE